MILCACGQTATKDYCGLDMCAACYNGRLAQDRKTHTANFQGDAGNDPALLAAYEVDC